MDVILYTVSAQPLYSVKNSAVFIKYNNYTLLLAYLSMFTSTQNYLELL